MEQALREAKDGERTRFDVQPGASDASDAAREPLRRAVKDQSLDGYVLLPKDVLRDGTITYYGRNVSNFGDLNSLEGTVGRVLVSRRLTAAGLDPKKVSDLTREAKLTRMRVSDTGEREDQGATFLLALILMMILYISILMWGQAVMTSVIEEKTSRVVEVMASGVPSTTLLLGKLIGVGSAGLTQFLVWALSLFGVSLASAGAIGSFVMPEIPPLLLVSFVVFFLLGYFFYSSLYATIGAVGQHRPGSAGPGVPGADADHPRDGVLAGRDAVPRRPARVHDLDDPGHVAAHHVPAHRGADAAHVADPALDRDPRGGDPGRGLVRRARLPRRHPDVRETADVPGDRALGAAQLAVGTVRDPDSARGAALIQRRAELEELEELDDPPPPPLESSTNSRSWRSSRPSCSSCCSTTSSSRSSSSRTRRMESPRSGSAAAAGQHSDAGQGRAARQQDQEVAPLGERGRVVTGAIVVGQSPPLGRVGVRPLSWIGGIVRMRHSIYDARLLDDWLAWRRRRRSELAGRR